jgi:hypothetical protein
MTRSRSKTTLTTVRPTPAIRRFQAATDGDAGYGDLLRGSVNGAGRRDAVRRAVLVLAVGRATVNDTVTVQNYAYNSATYASNQTGTTRILDLSAGLTGQIDGGKVIVLRDRIAGNLVKSGSTATKVDYTYFGRSGTAFDQIARYSITKDNYLTTVDLTGQ